MAEREDLLASIASTIKDYRAGEIAEPTPEHVDRWIRQFGDDVQVPMLRELDHVFKQTYVSKSEVQRLLTELAFSVPCDFWRAAHILSIQRRGRSQLEIRELFGQILRERCGANIDFMGSPGGYLIYLDDAVFTGEHVIEDLSYWIANHGPPSGNLHIISIACYQGGKYWIEQNTERIRSGKQIEIRFIPHFNFENRRNWREFGRLVPTDVLRPDEIYERNPNERASRLFSSIEGRRLLETEFLNAGIRIISSHNSVVPRLKPLGYSPFEPGFGSLFVTYRNCPNNAPLALWWSLGGGTRYSHAKPIPHCGNTMTSVSVATTNADVGSRLRTYYRADSAVFLKTREKYGGLSNMAGGFPLAVNGVAIRTSEALYQACRFPHLPDLQSAIIAQKSPMTAKMKGKPYRDISRPDWDAVRVKIMRWCLQVKLAQNWDKFSELLLETGDMPIVEHSRRDDFWGAKPIDGETLVGTNALGRLLMELRERLKDEPRENLEYVAPLPIPEFLLYQRPIEPIGCRVSHSTWEQVDLEIGEQEEIFDGPTQVAADTSPSAKVAETLEKYVLFDVDCPSTNINIATASELVRVKLPGIGAKIAQRIVDYRDQNGPFLSEDGLIAVPGIGPKTIENIAAKITV